MKQYFNVNLEFDKTKVDKIIQSTIANKGKGYVCSIESNNLTIANTNPAFLNVVNNALVNICDGSNIARILGRIHKQNLTSYIGADLFTKYVSLCRYKQYFLGNTDEVLAGLRTNLSMVDPTIEDMPFIGLPFRTVENFDYQEIAHRINEYSPDIIWVSLGAPKQEEFMFRLLPYIDRGVMFGFGAIFNFNAGGAGQVKRAPNWMLKLKLEWLYRAFEEPKKNIPRYAKFIKILPRLINDEYNRIKEKK
ncbi:WecB/TagA/CpsF family glycosyltransferase [Massilibacteroides sp.]|uniref:WecB/TagA/CpsF family glycosyltransferase n=1 Tax=Massilibacteroides sp. TaxID=2034766 RepID=UPI002638158E|nr:WecB/TagA/CpsF family glycosyltransferase [Massilibacteroides sp.]MDD4515333.1 WecB/TagA/CpsF family glycosyltransferase [Massilibacteroides sp.]